MDKYFILIILHLNTGICLDSERHKFLYGTIIPQVTMVFVGKPILFTCYSATQVEWTLPNEIKKDVRQNYNTVYIRSATLKHMGRCKCLGSLSDNSSFEAVMQIFVGNPNPEEDVKPIYMEAVVNETIYFHKPLSIEEPVPAWAFKTGSLSKKFPFIKRTNMLKVSRVQLENSGLYRCYYEFRHNRKSAKHYVAQVELKVLANSHDVDLIFGNNVSFTCGSEADKLTEVEWYYNRGPLPSNALAAGRFLNINNITLQNNEGQYTCEGYSYKIFLWTGKPISHTEAFNLRIAGQYIALYPSFQTVHTGTEVRFMCNSQNILEWTFMDQELPDNAIITDKLDRILIIKNVTTNNTGVYSCTYRNSRKKKQTITGYLLVLSHVELDEDIRCAISELNSDSESLNSYDCETRSASSGNSSKHSLSKKSGRSRSKSTWSGSSLKDSILVKQKSLIESMSAQPVNDLSDSVSAYSGSNFKKCANDGTWSSMQPFCAGNRRSKGKFHDYNQLVFSYVFIANIQFLVVFIYYGKNLLY